MKHTRPPLRTLSEIASTAGIARHRLAYLVARRGVTPDQIAGRVHLFGQRAAQYLVAEAKRSKAS